MPRRHVGNIAPSEGAGAAAADRAGGSPPTRIWRLWLYVGAAVVFALDQGSKFAATTFLKPLGSIPVLGGYVSLSYRTNTGAAFGLMPWASRGLELVAAAVVVSLVIYAWRTKRTSGVLDAALACVLGGAAGNLLDRVRLGYVVDFIDLHFWPVFNLADSAITVGAILVVCTFLISDFRRHTCAEGDHTNAKPPLP